MDCARAARRILAIVADSDEYAHLIAECWDAYHRGRATTAASLAQRATELDANDGRGWYALACSLERDGRLAVADRAFRRATAAEHEPHPPPFRVSWRRFERAVSDAAETMPDELQRSLGDVHLVLADYPGAEANEGELAYELLGLFTGLPRSEAQSGAGSLEITPSIHLYRRAHEHITSSAREFDDEVRRTLHHEFGHYLGFDEEDMDRFGLA